MDLHYGAGGQEGEGVRLWRCGVELTGQLRGAAEAGEGGPGLGVVEGGRSDRSRRRGGRGRLEGRSH